MSIRIISTTLAGPGTEESTLAALHSVGEFVDLHLVIYDSATFDLEAFEKLARASDIFDSAIRTIEYSWPGRFDMARNASLIHSEYVTVRSSCDWWAFTVDADERIGAYDATFQNTTRESLIATLGRTERDAIAIREGQEGYWQPRLFRLPCKARWSGRVHEAISITAERYEPLAFYGLPKTAERSFARWTRDTEQLSLQVKEEPDSARWWQYLARCHAALFRYWGLEASDALASYAYMKSIRCAERHPLDAYQRECGQWSRFMLARHLHERKIPRSLDALAVLRDSCLWVLAEIPYYAAQIYSEAGWYEDALEYCEVARIFMDRRPLSERLVFSEPALWRDGDLDTLERFLKIAIDQDRSNAPDLNE